MAGVMDIYTICSRTRGGAVQLPLWERHMEDSTVGVMADELEKGIGRTPWLPISSAAADLVPTSGHSDTSRLLLLQGRSHVDGVGSRKLHTADNVNCERNRFFFFWL